MTLRITKGGWLAMMVLVTSTLSCGPPPRPSVVELRTTSTRVISGEVLRSQSTDGSHVLSVASPTLRIPSRSGRLLLEIEIHSVGTGGVR